jgi:LPXTG-motif cell wall-anchored protein
MECTNGTQWSLAETCDYGCNPGTLECNPAPPGITGLIIGNPAFLSGIIAAVVLLGGGIYLWKRKK